jgi:hypothetical protein
MVNDYFRRLTQGERNSITSAARSESEKKDALYRVKALQERFKNPKKVPVTQKISTGCIRRICPDYSPSRSNG